MMNTLSSENTIALTSIENPLTLFFALSSLKRIDYNKKIYISLNPSPHIKSLFHNTCLSIIKYFSNFFSELNKI